jgi:fused signal recognition particle receptor
MGNSYVIPLLLVTLVLLATGAVIGFVVTRGRSRGEALEPPPEAGTPDGGVLTPPRRPGDPAPPEELSGPEVEIVDKLPVVLPPEIVVAGPELTEEEEAENIALAEEAQLADELDLLEPEVRPSFRERLTRARSTFAGYVGSILSRSSIDEESWEELEEALIRADVGVGPTQQLLSSVRARVNEQGITTPEELIGAVKAEMKERLAGPVELSTDSAHPAIWLFVGVNGVGKTTTIGKVGKRLTDDGRSVVMAAGDTFRAAAAEQLGTWAERCGADLVRGSEGGDPSSVVFDAVASAAAKGFDVVLADTAGRLHTKANLMEELGKVRRVADKGAGRVTEVLLVLDATTGQNGLNQARQFTEATDVTGVVLTKLDGSAKGGIVFAIRSELGIPVKLVGLGESAVDLVDFDADEFVEALFEQP